MGKWQEHKKTLDSKDVSLFIADDHKAAKNRHDGIRKTSTKHKNTKEPQKKRRLGIVGKNTGGFKHV